MTWSFHSKGSQGLAQEAAEYAKEQQRERMLADLFIRRYTLKADEIMRELERIHQFGGVPAWAPSGEPEGYLYQLTKELSETTLTRDETAHLPAMLSWPELRASKDRGPASLLVVAIVRQPAEAYIPALTEHLAWLEKEIKKAPSSQYRTEVESEIRLAKSAIQACRAGGSRTNTCDLEHLR